MPLDLAPSFSSTVQPEFWNSRRESHTKKYENDITKLFRTRLGMGLGITTFAVGAFYLSPIPMTAGVALFLISSGFNYYTDKRDLTDRVAADEFHVNQMLNILIQNDCSITWKKDLVDFLKTKQDFVVKYIIQYGSSDSLHRALNWEKYDWFDEANKQRLQNAHIIAIAAEGTVFNNKKENNSLSFQEAVEKYKSSDEAINKALTNRIELDGFDNFLTFMGGKLDMCPSTLGGIVLDLNYFKKLFLDVFKSNRRILGGFDIKAFKDFCGKFPPELIPETVGKMDGGRYKYENTFSICLIHDYINPKVPAVIDFARYVLKNLMKTQSDLTWVLRSEKALIFAPFQKGLEQAVKCQKDLVDCNKKIKAISHPHGSNFMPSLRPSEAALAQNSDYQTLLKERAEFELVLNNFKTNIPLDPDYLQPVVSQ